MGGESTRLGHPKNAVVYVLNFIKVFCPTNEPNIETVFIVDVFWINLKDAILGRLTGVYIWWSAIEAEAQAVQSIFWPQTNITFFRTTKTLSQHQLH